MKKFSFKIITIIFISFLVFPIIGQVYLTNSLLISNSIIEHGSVRPSALVLKDSTQWLNDRGFDYPTGNWTLSTVKDSTDVDGLINGSEANMMVVGDINYYSNISGTPLDSDWTPRNNTDVELEPTSYDINSKGCWVTHTWSDGSDPGQLTAIQWDRYVTLPVDMTDYNITSISLSVIANATVHADDGSSEGIEVYGEHDSGTLYENATGDFVRFYVYISDINKSEEYEIASLQPEDLGDDASGNLDYLYDSNLNVSSEESISNLMTSLLELDPEHKTIIFSLGILILCEDDWSTDQDIWDELVINQCNFSFTYEKKINQLSGVSWNQEGGKISDLSDDYYVQVKNATINFLYKINQTWPVSSSPSSEIRVLINNNPYPETVKLSTVTGSYQEFSVYGYNILSLLGDQVNFTIQMYLRDEFTLNRTIKVSIDNVSLVIYYELYTVETNPRLLDYLWPIVLILAIILAGVGSYFLAYQTYLKYPKFVRKIRGLRRKVRKGRNISSPLSVKPREKVVSKNLKERMKILRIEPEVERGGSVMRSAGKIDSINKLQQTGK